MLENENINVLKSPASTTEIFQPCDVGNCFKSAKCANKHLEYVTLDMNDPVSQTIKDMYDYHNSSFANTQKMPAAHKKMGMNGLKRVQLALNTSLNSIAVRNSFDKAGIYPFNLRKICLQCKTPFTEAEIEHFTQCLPELETILQNNGEITDQQLKDLGLADSYCNIVDNFIQTRRRAIILTHPVSIERATRKGKSRVSTGN